MKKTIVMQCIKRVKFLRKLLEAGELCYTVLENGLLDAVATSEDVSACETSDRNSFSR